MRRGSLRCVAALLDLPHLHLTEQMTMNVIIEKIMLSVGFEPVFANRHDCDAPVCVRQGGLLASGLV